MHYPLGVCISRRIKNKIKINMLKQFYLYEAAAVRSIL
jgi:hypothetical protein